MRSGAINMSNIRAGGQAGDRLRYWFETARASAIAGSRTLRERLDPPGNLIEASNQIARQRRLLPTERL